MNKEFHTFITDAAGSEGLSAAERARMRSVLEAYMAMKPIRGTGPMLSRSYVFWLRPVTAFAVVALLTSSVGVSYAAEGALPGDLLYPIKVSVNEPIAGAMAVSSSAKATWAASVAGERVKEAAMLAAEGRLAPNEQVALQSNFDAHAQIAIDAISSQSAASPDSSTEAAVRFDAQLSEYQRVLGQIAQATHSDVTTLANSIQEKHAALALVRANAEPDLRGASTSSSAVIALTTARIREAAMQQLDASERLARDSSHALAAPSADTVAAQLQSASDTISAADALSLNDPEQAMGGFQRALTAAEKLSVFLKTSSAIHSRTGLVIAQPDASSSGAHIRTAADVSARSAHTLAAPVRTLTVNEMAATDASTTSDGATTSISAELVAPEEASQKQGADASIRAIQVSVPTLLDDR